MLPLFITTGSPDGQRGHCHSPSEAKPYLSLCTRHSTITLSPSGPMTGHLMATFHPRQRLALEPALRQGKRFIKKEAVWPSSSENVKASPIWIIKVRWESERVLPCFYVCSLSYLSDAEGLQASELQLLCTLPGATLTATNTYRRMCVLSLSRTCEDIKTALQVFQFIRTPI